jgi:calcineurin-like phosphoesterase family protein
MDRKMIAKWQSQVAIDDDVFILGDVFFCNADKAKRIMHQLPGNKHLIYGNHDRTIRNDEVLQRLFATTQEYKELQTPGGAWQLFHYPIMEWNKMHRGAYHLHGHIHEKHSGVPGRIANVCIDSPTFGDGSYALYELDRVKAYLDRLPIRVHHEK